ncbi:MAG: universal stress protein [Opitutaceae bacterium]|nr:universal stress protein [Opitutaceae bacterium]
MKTILAPIDFSSASDDVVKAASELAGILSARIVLLHVVQPPVVTSDFGVGLDNVQELMVISEKAATKNLDRQKARLAKKGLEADGIVTTGAPIASILKEAERTKASYIVMGSHGHTAFYDLLVGSTTQGVLKRSKCPVMVLPTRAKSGKKGKKKK